MAKPFRVAIVWDWVQDGTQLLTWEDGFYAAFQELRKRGHDVVLYTLCEALRGSVTREGLKIEVFTGPSHLEALLREFKPSVILHWADMTRPNADIGRKLGVRQAVCFAGGDPFGPKIEYFDHIFVESEDYKRRLLDRGFSTSTAFGTNVNLYDPEDERVKHQRKVIDVCFPATFAAWKRHKLFAEAVGGYRAACLGHMYVDHEQECWQDVQRGGSLVLPHTAAHGVRHVLAASRVCLITSADNGGSQRTVLEAMAMNVPVIVMDDSAKTSEYVYDATLMGYEVGAVVRPEPGPIREAIERWKDRPSQGRQYVLRRWTHYHFADALETGLDQLVGAR